MKCSVPSLPWHTSLPELFLLSPPPVTVLLVKAAYESRLRMRLYHFPLIYRAGMSILECKITHSGI